VVPLLAWAWTSARKRVAVGTGGSSIVRVYHNVAAGRDEVVATNTATGRSQKITGSTPGYTYRHATLGVYIPNEGVTAPPANVRLWVFRNADETSYNGTHGTLYGPWPTVKFIDTTTGTVGGTVIMYPSSPSTAAITSASG
jgi:hypothetical protein